MRIHFRIGYHDGDGNYHRAVEELEYSTAKEALLPLMTLLEVWRYIVMNFTQYRSPDTPVEFFIGVSNSEMTGIEVEEIIDPAFVVMIDYIDWMKDDPFDRYYFGTVNSDIWGWEVEDAAFNFLEEWLRHAFQYPDVQNEESRVYFSVWNWPQD